MGVSLASFNISYLNQEKWQKFVPMNMFLCVG